MAHGDSEARAAFTLEQLEADAHAVMAPRLAQPVALCKHAYNVLLTTTRIFNGTALVAAPHSLTAGLLIVGRIASDLRSIIFLSEIGYGEQAGALASTVFELAHTAGFIGADDSIALAWARWSNPKKTFRSIHDLIRGSVKNAPLPDPQKAIVQETRCYAQLCWAKHASPVMQDFRAPAEWQTHGMLRIGPDVTEQGERYAWYALTHAARLAVLASVSLRQMHAPSTNDADIQQWNADFLTCFAVGKTRWPPVDPFPGQW